MVVTRQVRNLDLQASAATPGIRHISAASGMVVIGEVLYVVADDELHLGVFDLATSSGGQLVRLLDGELPHDPAARKAAKPDFEALVRLPHFAGHPYGALLALASGSRPNRRTGISLALDASGRIAGKPHAFDLAPFHVPLERDFPDLNIEGATIVDDQMVLLHRGGKSQPQSALIYFPLSRFLQAINAHDGITGPIVASDVRLVYLGSIDGSPLAFTDAGALPDGRIAFSAVAENTLDSYLDGPCLGAVIGILDRNGQVGTMQRLEPTAKVEGIHVMPGKDRLGLLLVTDADDANVPARLLAADIPLR